MATDRTFPEARTRLVQAAIRLLAANGPSEVKARSVSSEAGLSTMGVYSYFGGVPELLQAVADEGFERQAAIFKQVASTEDPMVDLCAMALGCRDFARRNPHLYDLMFGLSIHGRYSPSRGPPAVAPREQSAAFTASYSYLFEECKRLVESGCVRKIDPDLIAAQLWSSLHGFIMLELGGYFAAVADPAAEVLVPMCVNLIVGLGADREGAESSAAVATTGWARSLGVKAIPQRSRKSKH
ncbi:TetR family transcriptional regulator [Variovorax sp. WS11]|uniref:TetR/AcrR family transcriptional regulator n=1 Tax=Variovorax sp. WS11 TaxID=1105204 RepID=UPI000D0DADAE|nr:TetR/AcrR family transcriptional regulator [Variovorax sp. WS11]NDZ17683.1 TetR/AcrR family transcriptional regulator [Variovorax sp. WS11]PSL79549.1 TetR family transcriptional regulator [Variovorax sp. WS11]